MSSGDEKRIHLKWPARCRLCGRWLRVEENALWSPMGLRCDDENGEATCINGDMADDPPPRDWGDL